MKITRNGFGETPFAGSSNINATARTEQVQYGWEGKPRHEQCTVYIGKQEQGNGDSNRKKSEEMSLGLTQVFAVVLVVAVLESCSSILVLHG